MATYFFTFRDGSPGLETSELTDDQDAVGFAKIVAAEIGRETQKAAPMVTIQKRDGESVRAKERPLACARCSHEQRLLGIEQHSGELCFTFICGDCQSVETRSVKPIRAN